MNEDIYENKNKEIELLSEKLNEEKIRTEILKEINCLIE